MADSVPFLDIAVDHPQRLLGKSLQPQYAGLEIVRRYSHIEPHADDLWLQRQSRQLAEHAVDMMARLPLVAEVMLGRGEQAIGHHQIDRIVGLRRQSGEAAGEFERGAKIAIVELIDA